MPLVWETRSTGELEAILDRVVLLGALAAEMVGDAVSLVARRGEVSAAEQAIVGRDRAIATAHAALVRDLQLQIDWANPVSTDLYFVRSALRVIDDLKRISEYTVCIARIARCLYEEGLAASAFDAVYGEPAGARPRVPLRALRDIAQSMVTESVDVFITGDFIAADLMVARQGELELLKAEADRSGTGEIDPWDREALALARLAQVTHYLERIGAHAARIAERTLCIEIG